MEVTSNMPHSRLAILIMAKVGSLARRSAAVAYTAAITAPPLAPQIIRHISNAPWLWNWVLARLPSISTSNAIKVKRRRSMRAISRAQTPQLMAMAISSAAKMRPMAFSGKPSWSIKAPPRKGWICSVPREMTIIRQMAANDFLLSTDSSAFIKHHLG